MNDDVVNVQTELILFRLPFILVGSIKWSSLRDSQLFPKKKTFCGFPWIETSTAGRVYDLCVYYMTGAPEGSPKVVLCVVFLYGFMEKPGIEPATPGLQGIALIHYTTGGLLNLSHVWNTSIQYKSPEREKVIILAYIYFYNAQI